MSRKFFGHDELKQMRQLRNQGKQDYAEKQLLKAVQSPAVLDELRKIASTRAKAAQKISDWAGVVEALEGYTAYAAQWREHCWQTVRQYPPEHTLTDKKLLEEAKTKLK